VTLCHTGTSLPIIFLFISGFSFNIPIRVVTISTTFSGIKNCAFFPLVTLLISLRTNSYYSFIWHYSFGTGVLYLIHINHQADATIFQFIILTFVYSSTCFGRFSVHHQELNDCSGSLWFYLRIVVTAVLMRTPRLPVVD